MINSGDETQVDPGYPSTVELADGSLLTTWYKKLKKTGLGAIRQAKWKLYQ